MPRVLFLGALKLTTVFVFGFFAVVALPTYVQDAPIWQSAACKLFNEPPPPSLPVFFSHRIPLNSWSDFDLYKVVVASTIPFLAVWYLTSPMVMWVHLRVPKEVQRSKHRLERYFTNPPAGVSVIITTMGALGKPRVSHVKLADLQRVKQRLGLVNYARDTTLENAQRKWYEFPAVGQFMIEDAPTSGQKAKKPWMWYTLLDGFKNQRLQIARQAKESSKKV